VHFWAGYVPPHHSIETFAQALRAIGEPIHGRPANEISMADLLGQLFAYTQVFDMQTRPELILLQKTMVVVEGVARDLDPTLDIWTAAEPIARAWMEENFGLPGQIKAAGEGAGTLGKLLPEVPALLQQAERTAAAFGDMAQSGLRLDDATVEAIAAANTRGNRAGTLAMWIGALALVTIAVLQYVRG
jgi:ubiquinone biosynthesis protein